jgi:hypothetical protein
MSRSRIQESFVKNSSLFGKANHGAVMIFVPHSSLDEPALGNAESYAIFSAINNASNPKLHHKVKAAPCKQ